MRESEGGVLALPHHCSLVWLCIWGVMILGLNYAKSHHDKISELALSWVLIFEGNT